ncbi:MAG: UbiD family decarboxylase [Chloroflexi bacterium]|nr:UbiD family decarboxylase [Chloroflexota bacterium]
MAYRDLREWLQALDANGELLKIKEEIRLEPDVGAIGGALCELQGPAVLAENICGYRDARLTLRLHATLPRTALALGLPKGSGPSDQTELWRKAYKNYPLKSRTVNRQDAPCKENICHGKDVNLFNFPISRLYTQDAAPYLTKTMVITREPGSDWVNFGMYRMMVLDRNRTSIMTSPTSHWGRHYTKARRLGKPLEMAVALGTEPILPMVSSVRIPVGWNEFDFASALRGEPEEIVPAESVDLPVPATAEIVLEGIVSPEANVFEGPFSEFTGAYSGAMMMPSFNIKTITYRNNPILDNVYGDRSSKEGHWMSLVAKCVTTEQALKPLCPSITQIAYLPPHTFNCVIQGKWLNKMEPRQAMLAFWAAEASIQSKMVTIVDEDVNPWNAEDVMWAISTRCQADTDIVTVPGMECRLDPSMEPDGTTCKFGIDATKSKHPHPRHTVSEWITPSIGIDAWKEKILRLIDNAREQ